MNALMGRDTRVVPISCNNRWKLGQYSTFYTQHCVTSNGRVIHRRRVDCGTAGVSGVAGAPSTSASAMNGEIRRG